MPPSCAIATAIGAVVTVSMLADTIGTSSSISGREARARRDVLARTHPRPSRHEQDVVVGEPGADLGHDADFERDELEPVDVDEARGR